jgi:hypothetical protein
LVGIPRKTSTVGQAPGVDVVADDDRTLFGEPSGDGRADAAGSAGDDGHPAVEHRSRQRDLVPLDVAPLTDIRR